MGRGREILFCGHGEHPKNCLICEVEKLKQQLIDANEVLRSYEIITNGKLDEHKKYKDKYKGEGDI